jgi:hypothetical protein
MPTPSASRAVTRVTDTHARARGKWQKRFLEVLAETPSVKAACLTAGVSRMTAYRYRHSDPEFAEQWQDAIDQSVDDLEAVAFKLAVEGDAGLIQFMLRCHKPQVYNPSTKVDAAMLGGIVLLPAKEGGKE